MSWITTYTGRHVHPLDPRPEEFCIEDVAHALSMKCRWTGHTRAFYSVAEHSIRVSWFLRDLGFGSQEQLAGLLHDAGEAFLPDVASPIKDRMLVARDDHQRPGLPLTFRQHEDALVRAICAGIGVPDLPQFMHAECVMHADLVLLATEARDLMHGTTEWNWTPPAPLVCSIDAMKPEWARLTFLGNFQGLMNDIAQEAAQASRGPR